GWRGKGPRPRRPAERIMKSTLSGAALSRPIGSEAIDRATRRRGAMLVAAAAICWSSGGAIARMIESDPWTTVFWRSAFAAAALFAFILWRDRARTVGLFRGMGWPGLAVAACFATASTSFVYALT